MTFGQLLFWIIVAFIAYYAYEKMGINILIIAIAILVLYYLVSLFTGPKHPTQIVVPMGAPRYEGFYDVEPFAGMNHPSNQSSPLDGQGKHRLLSDHGDMYQQHQQYQQQQHPSGKYFDIDEKIGTKIILNTCGGSQE